MTDAPRLSALDGSDQVVAEIDVMPPEATPDRVFDHAGAALCSLLYEPLFMEGASGTVRPAAALACETGADSLTWRIHLAEHGRWGDGSPITAWDVVRAIDTLAESQASPVAWIADIIVGVREVRDGGQAAIGRTVIDSFCVEVRTVRPVGRLDAILASVPFTPRHEAMGHSEASCSGPYRVAGTYPHGRGVILDRNPESYRAGVGSPRRLVLLRTDDPIQGLRLFESDHVHVTNPTTFPPELIPQWRDHESLRMQDMLMTAQFEPAAGSAIAASRRLRHALSQAIDRHAVAGALSGAVVPLWRFTELWSAAEPACPLPIDRREEWRNAGGPSGITIAYADFRPNDSVVGEVADALRDRLGIAVSCTPLTYAEYLNELRQPACDLLYTLTPAAYDDPSSMLAPFRSEHRHARRRGFHSVEFDRLIDEAESERYPVARLRRFELANDVMLEDMPVVPLVRSRSAVLCKPWLAGLRIERSGVIRFEEIAVESDIPAPAATVYYHRS